MGCESFLGIPRKFMDASQKFWVDFDGFLCIFPRRALFLSVAVAGWGGGGG